MPSQDFIDSFWTEDSPVERRRNRAMARVDEAHSDVVEAAQSAVKVLPDWHPLRHALMRLESAQRAWLEATR